MSLATTRRSDDRAYSWIDELDLCKRTFFVFQISKNPVIKLDAALLREEYDTAHKSCLPFLGFHAEVTSKYYKISLKFPGEVKLPIKI